jgi:thiamine pyrophosphokinase
LSDQRRAIVFANGLIDDYSVIPPLIEQGDLIIAADGGARHCNRLGLRPDYLIGDFDSLPAEELLVFAHNGAKLIRHPAQKDYTDLELALLHARSAGVAQILVFGGLGARWDQTLANLLLPASTDLLNIHIHLIDGKQEMTMLRSGEKFTIHGDPGDTVSLIPISGDAYGVSTQGLEYPLDDETLHMGATRGVSNSLLEDSGSVSVKQGSLVCVIIHQTPGKLMEVYDD